MIIFPEGTRFNPSNKDLVDKTRLLAEKKGKTNVKSYVNITAYIYT